jgi:alpha-tubulin suppressor-like RCC1 family protein
MLGGLLPWAGADVGAATTGGLRAWGLNGAGQLGDGTTTTRNTSAPVVTIGDVSAVAAGGGHSLAVTSDGGVWAWGYNVYGQLGDGTTTTRNAPVTVGGLGGVTAVAAGTEHSLALKGDGTVWAWGANSLGQLGDGTTMQRTTPVQVSGLGGVVAIAAGFRHSLAIKNDGTLWTWGYNGYGQLGDDSLTNRSTPVQATGLAGVTAVSAGYAHSLAVAGGNVWTWGRNVNGQLGDGTTTDRDTPAALVGLSGVTTVAAGDYHSLALLSDGTVRAWGHNAYGQLGDGTTTPRTAPVQVSGLGGVTALAAGVYHSLAALREPSGQGTVRAWGFNGFGRLGDGTTTNRNTPVAVGGISSAVAVAAGDEHSLALVATVALTVEAAGGGVARDPDGGTPGTGSGSFPYPLGATVELSPQPNAGQVFVRWTVDGVDRGWADTISVTMDEPHTVVATFASPTTFVDTPANRADYAAIVALATRGTIRGYDAQRYGPDDGVQRAQMAALIARAMEHGPGTPPGGVLTPPACLIAGSWDCEDWGNNFTDRNGLDGSLWRNAGTLQHYRVALGYAAGDCAAKGRAFPCFGPTDPVTYAETITFITRAMIAKGYWAPQPGAPQPYSGVPSVFAPEVATFHYYTGTQGGIPTAPSTMAGWNAQATRGWFAMALWRALDSHFGR